MSEQLRTVPWYDRNPKEITKSSVNSLLAPHTYTTRFTYTVPSNRNCYIGSAFAHIIRREAATTSSIVTSEIFCRGTRLIIAEAALANVGDCKTENMGRSVIMPEKGVLYARTRDLSEGGSCDFFISAYGIEFDVFPIEALPFEVEMPKVDIQQPKKPWWWPF